MDIIDYVLNLYNSSAPNTPNGTANLRNMSELLDSVDSTVRQFVKLYRCTSHDYFEGYPDEESLVNRATNTSELPVIAS